MGFEMSDVPVETATPFADYGCEKMIYDVRMGPQAVERVHLDFDELIRRMESSRSDWPGFHQGLCAASAR